MFIVCLCFLEDNIHKTDSFEEESYLCTKRVISALRQQFENRNNQWGLSMHRLMYKHMLEYFAATEKKSILNEYLIVWGMIILSSLRKFLEEKIKMQNNLRNNSKS